MKPIHYRLRHAFMLIVGSLSLLTVALSSIAAPPGGLPPGLQKKAERGQPLPPGWQKKLQVGAILDDDIYHYGVVIRPRDRDGYITIRVDNEIIRLVDATREIVEILSQ